MIFSIKRRNYLFSFLVLMLVLLSGNPFFNIIGFEVAHLLFLFVLFYLCLRHGLIKKIGAETNFFLIFSFVFVLQSLFFSQLNLISYTGFFVRALLCLLVMIIVTDFVLRYIQIMYYLTQLGIVLWVVSFSGIFIFLTGYIEPLHYNQWTGESAYSLLFHTLYIDENGQTLRNAGVFWEPGAFASYIVFALVLLILNYKAICRKVFIKFVFVFTLGILTTMSTMGYLSLFMVYFVLFFIYFKDTKSSFDKLIVLFFSFFISIVFLYFYVNTDFVAEKIIDQLMKATELSVFEYGESNTRFGSLLFDLYYFEKSPVFGNGLHESTRYADHNLDLIASGHGNGLSDFLAKFGLIGFLFFLVSWFKFSKIYHNGAMISVLTLIVIFCTLFSEPLFNYPLYWALFFSGSIARNYKNT